MNGVPTNIPSYQLKPGDKVEVREIAPRRASRSRSPRRRSATTRRRSGCPIDADTLSGSIVTPPSRDQMPLDLNEQLVVEYYSR